MPVVQYLVKECNVSVDSLTGLYSGRIFHVAARSGSVRVVQYLVEHGASFAEFRYGVETTTVIKEAIAHLQVATTRVLVDFCRQNSVSVANCNGSDRSMLRLAIQTGGVNVDMVRYASSGGGKGGCR